MNLSDACSIAADRLGAQVCIEGVSGTIPLLRLRQRFAERRAHALSNSAMDIPERQQ